ncbi:hypothetical protein [Aeromonas jandaei]|uniref:hypothetical protein n=1 Tax=Aeromonas jandaei TaxID=650 RepID=UPI00207B320C|nr:hypothetical protein [Aeromonas jandaei]
MIHSSYVSNYDKYPEVTVVGYEQAACAGWDAIAHQLLAKVNRQERAKVVLVIDCYHGVDQGELRTQLLARLGPHTLIDVEQARLPESKVLAMLDRFITDDRVFGVLAPHKMVEFFDPVALAHLQQQVAEMAEGLVVVMGSGASLVAQGDVRVYADLARWEIQQRLRRKEIGNWGLITLKRTYCAATSAPSSSSGGCLTAINWPSCLPSISCSTPTPGASRPW